MKTDEEWGRIRQAAQHRCQTAVFLCQRMKAQLDQLAKRQDRLHKALAQLRKRQRALRYAQVRRHDRETTALINILQRMSVSGQC